MSDLAWISVEDRLPEEGQHVLVHLAEEAQNLTAGGKPVTVIACMFQRMKPNEMCGNDLRPYRWEHFGPGIEWGQDVTHWMPLPEFDEEGM